MTDVPNIFALPRAQWSDRASVPVEGPFDTMDATRRLTERLIAFGAAAIAWTAVAGTAGLIWFVAG